MKSIAFLVEDNLHKQIKLKSTINDKTLKDYIIDLIKEDLKQQKENSLTSNQ